MSEGLLKRFWTGKSVLLTGASSGLGLAVVQSLAPYGVHFGLVARRREPMEALVRELSGSPSRFSVYLADVRRRDEVERAIEAFHSEAGRIDVVWANSGVGGDSFHDEWDWTRMENLIDTNLKGLVYTVQPALTRMVARGRGTVVAISSVAAMRGLPGSGLYSGTKAAVEFYMHALATEVPAIQFTTIFPGFVDTPINKHLGSKRLWVMPPEKAARLMITAVAKGKAEYIYPCRMAAIFRLVRLMPARLARWVGRRAVGGR